MPNSWTVILKRLRVHQDSRGKLQVGRAPVDPFADRENNEAWWREVLTWDRRLKPPEASSIPKDSPDAWYRLDRYPGFYFEARCDCGLEIRGRRRTETLIEKLGGDMNTVYLARHMIDCKARNKVTNNCQAYPVR